MISIIAAIGENGELGKNGDLCWRLKADLQRFKKLTTGHTVAMGYNTYKSLGFKPLKDRENIVLTERPLEVGIEGVEQVYDLEELKKELLKREDEVFIIGGGWLYSQFLPIADRLYLTEIHKTDSEADTFFPAKEEWEKEFRREVEEDRDEYSYVTYNRV